MVLPVGREDWQERSYMKAGALHLDCSCHLRFDHSLTLVFSVLLLLLLLLPLRVPQVDKERYQPVPCSSIAEFR